MNRPARMHGEAVEFIEQLDETHVTDSARCPRCRSVVARLLLVDGHRVLHVLGGRYRHSTRDLEVAARWSDVPIENPPKRAQVAASVYELGTSDVMPDMWIAPEVGGCPFSLVAGCRKCRRPAQVVVGPDWSVRVEV